MTEPFAKLEIDVLAAGSIPCSECGHEIIIGDVLYAVHTERQSATTHRFACRRCGAKLLASLRRRVSKPPEPA